VLKGKRISVISSNTLLGVGLKTILTEFFSPEAVIVFPDFEEYIKNVLENQYDLIFLPPNLYVTYNEHFLGLNNKLIILKENELNALQLQTALASLEITLPQSEIVGQLEKIFFSKNNHLVTEIQDDLSAREKEVLKLVALGKLNKNIADQLCISLHTVISHRKNIIRKLGIKTVSGLTVYALLNGFISGREIE
jgi:DNA-binding CsgD family transcriptional regulator